MTETSEVVDQTTQDVTDKGGKPDTEEKPDTDAAEEKPEDKDTKPDDSGKDREASAFMNNLLSEYNVASPEQLADFIEELATVKDALGDEDIQDLIDNKKLMIQYQMQWAEAEEKALREKETPEETIDRLEGDLKKQKLAAEREKQRVADEKENKRLIRDFNSFVGKNVDALKIGDHLKPHLKKYLGVDNPIHDVELSNKVAIKKMITDAGKMLEDLEQTILKKANLKKDEVPTMSDTETSTAAPETEEPTVKNMADARKQATALLKQKLRR